MSGATEIYICQPGQEIKQGKLEYSSSVITRDDAVADAERRSRTDPSIGLIAYYSVGEDGSFRSLYTFENKQGAQARRRRFISEREHNPAIRRKRRQKKQSFLEKLLSSIW